MTITYTVSQDGLRIKAIPKGRLSTRETIDYFNCLKNDKRVKKGAIEIVYFKDVTDFKISFQESENITINYQETKEIKTILSTIFVCESDLAYGIGRMLQTFHEITNPEHKVVIVRSEGKLENLL